MSKPYNRWHAIKWLTTLVLILGILYCVWYALPNWIVRPNAEATPNQYEDAAKVGPTSDYDSGKCPALKMDVAKALNDGRLTAREVHELNSKAYELAERAEAARNKNAALQSAGVRPTEPMIECPYGRSLFDL
jgi:hypothetical protein